MAARRDVGGNEYEPAKIKPIGDMWNCDWRGICAFGHDWVGLGPNGWPDDTNDSNRHRNVNRGRYSGRGSCKLGDPNWANDCHH